MSQPVGARHCKCEACPSNNARLVYRLDPRNWHQNVRRLCADCSRRLGHSPVNFDRPYSGQGDGRE